MRIEYLNGVLQGVNQKPRPTKKPTRKQEAEAMAEYLVQKWRLRDLEKALKKHFGDDEILKAKYRNICLSRQ